MRNTSLLAAAMVVGTLGLVGCSRTVYVQQPVAQAPPISGGMTTSSSGAPTAGVFQWQDVPNGQQVPVARTLFDQGGYQIIAQTGETILVPFVNQNLNVMRFGRSATGQPYFVNEGDSPVLYLRPDNYLENSANANARWYPLPSDFSYSRPVYVSLAPSWNDYIGMNWYSGMNYYGGMWGYTPRAHFAWMPSYYISIGGTRYNSYNSYRTYYTSHPGIRYTTYSGYNRPRSTGSFGSGRVSGSTGSFGSGRVSGSTGSFGSGRVNGGTGSFGSGRSTGSTGSFGSGRSMGGTGTSGSFGSGRSTGTSGTSGSFGSGRSTGSSGSSGSFGGGSPTIRNTPAPSSGSSFGGSRSTGGSGSFGGRSSGGSSFGGRSSGSSGSSFGGGRSSGGSFGGSRRR